MALGLGISTGGGSGGVAYSDFDYDVTYETPQSDTISLNVDNDTETITLYTIDSDDYPTVTVNEGDAPTVRKYALYTHLKFNLPKDEAEDNVTYTLKKDGVTVASSNQNYTRDNRFAYGTITFLTLLDDPDGDYTIDIAHSGDSNITFEGKSQWVAADYTIGETGTLFVDVETATEDMQNPFSATAGNTYQPLTWDNTSGGNETFDYAVKGAFNDTSTERELLEYQAQVRNVDTTSLPYNFANIKQISSITGTTVNGITIGDTP